ncbi:hypothetical protein HU200_029094 [Digitaria exilis]|uniref:Protein kinase domain-containing protein n=1 Tax=Digitaria exilis TaxID=1010633 RepID=A0A835EUV8_9POAL|nr:hypothetical protein HU200_029094 [Digitaria exilis]
MKLTAIGPFVLVLIASCTHVVICSSNGNYADRLALLEFKKAISLDPHQAMMSWNDSTHFCSWEGLVGQISPSLGNLTFLKILVLSANSFSEEIPMSLGNLHRLQILSLHNNTLQGKIPALANCSKLTDLLLANNQLTGQIPVDLPQRLENLDLTTNKLTGTIPDSVANMTGLWMFSCAMNKIEGNIPNGFANLQGLQVLRVSINKMSGQFPQAILNLSNLAELSIAINNFSGVVPSSLGNSLPDLQAILLDENFFHGHIPPSLTNASKLSFIDISNNGFTGVVPSSFGKLPKLSLLSLQLNNLQASNKQNWKFMDGLANCSELSALSVAYNYLRGQVPDSVGNLSSELQGLYLGGNQLSGNFPSGIANLRNLVTVSLFENNFTSVLPEWLGTLNSLQVLQLSDNFFTGLIPSSFSNLSQLISIDLEQNQLNGQIPPSLGGLQMLQALLISSNNLHGTIPKEIFRIPTLVRIPSTLGNCESLEIIELDHNFFSGSIPTFLGNISNLHFLNLSHNNLTGSIPVALSGLQFLEQLDLSFNHLKGEVPTKGIFTNATALRINGNKELCGGPLRLHLPKIVIPLAIVLAFAAVSAVWFFRRRNQKTKAISLPSLGRFPRISYGDLVRATEGFARSNLIGKLFRDEKVVAIKVFSLETRGAQKSFIAECGALRNVRHRNLVPILTACSSIDSNGNDFKALVYRLSIMVDVADALAYLHHNHQGSIVHCDLKPSNILLDDNMVAHVGDFGLARFRSDSTGQSFADSNPTSSVAIKGTIGYIAPEQGEDVLASVRDTGAQILQSVLSIGLCCTKTSPNERISMQEAAAKLHGIQDAYLRGN